MEQTIAIMVSGDAEEPETQELAQQKALPIKPKACRDHVRKKAARAWGEIVDKLLAKAKDGSVPHITLVVKLAGFEQGPMAPRGPKRRGKSLAQQLREEMEELEARNIAEFGE